MSKVQGQRQAVFAATLSVLADAGIEFEEGVTSIESIMESHKELRASICEIVCEGFRQGTIEFKATPSNQEKLANPAKLSGYVSGLVSNWFRKDPRLNGGEKYVAKNPGSRAGSSDPQLKALRQLLSVHKGTDKEGAIKTHIESRMSALQAEKTKQVNIDTSVLPEDLVTMLGLAN